MKKPKYWDIDTFEISSYAFGIKKRKNRTYKTSGSDNSGICTYTYNELGFRGDSIHKNGFKVMSIGCSLTEGVGVNNDETWPSQFCSHVPNSVNFNFGTGGRSNDFITRCLISFYDFIKPDLVLLMYTSPLRREIYTKNNGIEPFMSTTSWGYLKEDNEGKKIQDYLTYTQNENEDLINWYKNHLLIKYFLESKKCNWIWNGSFLNINYEDLNRYDGDYINFIDRGVDGWHPGPRHNKIYSIKLIEYILNNHNSFLPSNTKLKKSVI
jgi:hypothetical protein